MQSDIPEQKAVDKSNKSVSMNAKDLFLSIFEHYIKPIELFFPLLLLAILPGFGSQGTLVGASIGLLALVVFSLPVRYFINSRSFDVLLWLEPVAILLGGFLAAMIIESATSVGPSVNIQTLWHIFALFVLVGKVVFVINQRFDLLNQNLKMNDFYSKSEKPIVSGLIASIVFAIFFVAAKLFDSALSIKLYAYMTTGILIVFRLWVYSEHYSKISSLSWDHLKRDILNGRALDGGSTQDFRRSLIIFLLRILAMYYLFSEFLLTLKASEIGNMVLWSGAVQTVIVISLIRQFAKIKMRQLEFQSHQYSLFSAVGPLAILVGVVVSGSHFLTVAVVQELGIYGLSTLLLLVMTDIVEGGAILPVDRENITASQLPGVDSQFLAQSFAQLVLGLLLSLISIYYQYYASIFVGFIIGVIGVYLLVSSVFLHSGPSGTAMKTFVRIQLVKIVMFLTMVVVGFDIISYAFSMREKRSSTIKSTIETVLIGIKPAFIQGDSVQANNFLFSLKKGGFIGCFKLDFGSLISDDCEMNEAPIARYESVNIPVVYDGNSYGGIELYFDFGFLKRDLFFRVLLDVVLSLIFFFVLIRLFNVIAKRFFSEVELLNEILSSGKSELSQKPQFAIFEFQRMAEEIQESIQLRETVQYHTAMNKVANQVAHDIRSPLMALNVAIQMASGLDARSRDLIRNSANRIRDIANNLVQKSKMGIFEIVNSEVTVEMIGAIVEDLASEKRLEYRKLSELTLDTDTSQSYGLFSKIHAYDLKRVLSNLINNCNDALKSKGKIQVNVRRSEIVPSRLMVEILDDGPGFSETILEIVGHERVSFGKAEHSQSGLGLGTYHAMQIIKSWGGEIFFQNIYDSSQGVQSVPKVLGARVLIELPIVEAPQWFCPEIKIYNKSQIMIFDDDHTVQMMWKEKIRKLKFDGMTEPFHCVAFGYGRQLMENTFGNLSEIDTVFVDYEIAGDQKTGLDYIRDLSIERNSVLITSHYEDIKIQQAAIELGIKIIPKTMAHLVPFHFNAVVPDSDKTDSLAQADRVPENLYDGVLIDDSPEIHLVWNVHRNGKKIKIYTYPKAFLDDCQSLDTKSPIFLDLHFGKHGEGMSFVKDIYDRGFKDITIVTSYAKAHVVIPPELKYMIREVRGKIPPWAKSTGLEQYEF